MSPPRRRLRKGGLSALLLLFVLLLSTATALSGLLGGLPQADSSKRTPPTPTLPDRPPSLSDPSPPETPSFAYALKAPENRGATYLLSLPFRWNETGFLSRAFLSTLEEQGILESGSIPPAYLPLPPMLYQQDARRTCDLNGDGVDDAASNEIFLGRPPYDTAGETILRAIDGKEGRTLWSKTGLTYTLTAFFGAASWVRPSDPIPRAPPNVRDLVDLDGDGVCDFVATRLVTSTSFRLIYASGISFWTDVLAISGKDGSEIWKTRIRGNVTLVQTPTNVVVAIRIENFPSGFEAFESPRGPRVVLKTSDIDVNFAQDPVGLTEPIFRGGLYFLDQRISDHIHFFDAKEGKELFVRDLPASSDPSHTNLTWISGIGDLDGDGEPDLLLEHYLVQNPRSAEPNDPMTGEAAYRFEKGFRVTALSGSPERKGETLWVRTIREETGGHTPQQVEESAEQLVWTRARLLSDVNGDGVPDVVAQYLAVEEGLSTTVNGAFRTHIVLLDGKSGRILWEVRQMGWGFASPLGEDSLGNPYVGFGILDIPTPPPPGGRFPPKYVRLGALDGRTGSVVWSTENRFAQNSFVVYQQSLAQIMDSLAPLDLDGDGVLDVVTPSQYGPPQGSNQVLLALSNHTYEILSGATGERLGRIRAWGPDGRVLPCKGAMPGTITTVTGYARRFDLTRFDLRNGTVLWRTPIWNDPAPRAATAAKDFLGMLASCEEDSQGRTFVSLNAHEFSFDRRWEVVSVQSFLSPNGSLLWIRPELRGDPPVGSIFSPSQAVELSSKSSSSSLPLFLASALVGGLLGLGTLLVVRRIPRILSLLLVLVVILPSVASGVSSSPPSGKAPSPNLDPKSQFFKELRDLGPRWTERDLLLAAVRYLGALGFAGPNPEDTFEENLTLSYTYEIGDVDGDGVTDLAFDEYCVDRDACGVRYRSITDVGGLLRDWVTPGSSFGAPHHLWGISGKTGRALWNRSLMVPQPFGSLGVSFVVGTVPLPNSTGIVVYTYVVHREGGVGVVEHSIEAIDGRTGRTAWAFNESGYYIAAGVGQDGAAVMKNVLLLPYIQSPPRDEAKLKGLSTSTALFVEGVGGRFLQATSSPLTPPIFQSDLVFLTLFQPDEWAARINLTTGRADWRVETFVSTDPTQSYRIELLDPLPSGNPWFTPTQGVPETTQILYWETRPCCFDLTGDGVPDLLFRVYSYSSTPEVNLQGPYFLNSSLVLFDGKTGERKWTVPVGKDIQVPYRMRVEPLGDADGDGTADILLHEDFFDWLYHHDLSVRSGKDGHVLWSLSDPRDLGAVVLGDADGDGGNDFLLLDWYGVESRVYTYDDFLTPQRLPIVLVSGRDGRVLWRTETLEAPSDAVHNLNMLRLNGLVDFDGDGVGDLVVDDPLYLGDQTVIHRQKILSGRDAHTLYTVENVGAFAVPSKIPDVSGDGRPDLAILSGDLSDLWITAYNGTEGNPLWSRRLLALPASNSASVLPRIRFHALTKDRGAGEDLLVNFHFYMLSLSHYFYVSGDGYAEVVTVTGTITPQILRIQGTNGSIDWSFPTVPDSSDGRTMGETPSSFTYHTLEKEVEKSFQDRAWESAKDSLPFLSVGALSYVLVLAGGLLLGRLLRRRKDLSEEVIDLEL